MRRIKSIVEMRAGAYYTAMVTYRNGKCKLYGYGMDAYPRAVERFLEAATGTQRLDPCTVLYTL